MERHMLTLGCLLGAAALWVSAGARAQDIECAADADCGHGYMCETGSFAACPEIAILCEEGEECEQPSCEPQDYASCVLAPCEQDSDCPDNLSCQTESWQECDYEDVACEDGQACERPEPMNCREVSNNYCAPPWELPCQTDSDCGEGFRCQEFVEMWCNGSTGSAGSGDSGGDSGEGDATPAIEPEEPECGSNPTGEFYCQQQDIPCESDAQCPELWSCTDNPLRAVCQGAAGPDGEALPCETTQPDNDRVCLPPSYDRGGLGFAIAESAAAGSATGSPVAATSSNVEDGDDVAAGESEGDDDVVVDDGCQVGRGAAGNGAWLLLALGALALSRRRRHQLG